MKSLDLAIDEQVLSSSEILFENGPLLLHFEMKSPEILENWLHCKSHYANGKPNFVDFVDLELCVCHAGRDTHSLPSAFCRC